MVFKLLLIMNISRLLSDIYVAEINLFSSEGEEFSGSWAPKALYRGYPFFSLKI